MLRQLIVNADDYGLTPGVSRGILKAHQAGIVTSTSVMINMRAAEEWLHTAQAGAPELGLGLHINLTTGSPVSQPGDIPDLVRPNGTFHPHEEIIGLLPTIDITQIEREMLAQVARFEEITGKLPDHLDSHDHIAYLSPATVKLLIKLAQELSIPVRNPLPAGDFSHQSDFLHRQMRNRFTRVYAEEMVDILHSYAEKGDIVMPGHLVSGLYGDGATLGNLLLLLLDVPEGLTELMAHPGEVDADLPKWSTYIEKRQDELDALTHPSAREVINSEFIQLLNFGDIKLFETR